MLELNKSRILRKKMDEFPFFLRATQCALLPPRVFEEFWLEPNNQITTLSRANKTTKLVKKMLFKSKLQFRKNYDRNLINT